jgi:hypothetical protein
MPLMLWYAIAFIHDFFRSGINSTFLSNQEAAVLALHNLLFQDVHKYTLTQGCSHACLSFSFINKVFMSELGESDTSAQEFTYDKNTA